MSFSSCRQNQAKSATIAYRDGGNVLCHGRLRHWTTFLPEKSEVLATRLVDPYGVINASVASCPLAVGAINLAHLGHGSGGNTTLPATSTAPVDNTMIMTIATEAAAVSKEAKAAVEELSGKSRITADDVDAAIRENNNLIVNSIKSVKAQASENVSSVLVTMERMENAHSKKLEELNERIKQLEASKKVANDDLFSNKSDSETHILEPKALA